jgi:hypothetical protein
VTPPFKNGQPPVTDGNAAVAENDFAFSSLGAFDEPGNSTTAEGAEYVTHRAGGGWSTVPVNPSGEEFQGGSALLGFSHETLDFNASLTETLILQPRREAKPIDARFYRRRVSDGSLQEVGPLVRPDTVAIWKPGSEAELEFERPLPFYLGASADLSHIFFTDLFEANGPYQWLWQGDKTIGDAPSLYEYVGSNNTEPELVAVKNQTTLARAAAEQHKSHINEAAEQITECGVVLGGTAAAQLGGLRSEDTFNAIAASGERVFFTVAPGPCVHLGEEGQGPSVGELYARIDREKTVDISEPSTGPSGNCESCDESEPSTPVFQGASEDGTKVFFLTGQKLFAGAHGESGTNLYEFDFDGEAHHKLSFIAPQLPESSGMPGGLVQLAPQAGFVYFVSQDAALAGNVDGKDENAVSGEPNLFVYDTETRHTTFVATLSSHDERIWDAAGARRGQVTPDGRFLLFQSTGNLTPDASGDATQLYRYEVPTAAKANGELLRISVGAGGQYECAKTHTVESGYNCDGNAGPPPGSVFGSEYTHNSEPELQSSPRPTGVVISGDGSKVFFESPEGLTPGAPNENCAHEAFGECTIAADNVYEWEGGEVYLLSDGLDSNFFFGASASKLVAADPSGQNVYITSGDSLVPRDTDSQLDVYDLRTDGGFPPEPTAVPCSSACRAGEAEPQFSLPTSAVTQGPGNFASGPPSSGAKPTPKPKVLTRAQKLAKALKACRRLRKRARAKCQRTARRRYGPSARRSQHAPPKTGTRFADSSRTGGRGRR